MIEGIVGLWHDGAETRLEEGDAVYFDCSRPHRYRSLDGKHCTGLVVTVP